MYRMRSGFGAVDCGPPPLMSDFTAGHADCQLGGGAQTEECLTLQDNTEQAFIAAQAAWNACKGSNAPGVDASIAMATYGTQVYGANAAAAAQQSAIWDAALIGAPGDTTAPDTRTPAQLLASSGTPQVPPPPKVVISSSPTPAVPVVIQSSGASTAPPASGYNSSAPPVDNSTPATSFSLSSIPWWGWAGAAAVAVFAMGKR